MNIYNYLKKDHKVVDDLFDKILSAHLMEKRKTLFEELKNELLVHAETENATFYKALKQHQQTKDIIKHAKKEHDEVKEYTQKISHVPLEDEKWLELLGELKHAVTHHVAEEEGEIFKEAKKVLTKKQETQLVEDMETLKYQRLYAPGAA